MAKYMPTSLEMFVCMITFPFVFVIGQISNLIYGPYMSLQ
jgi:hypothetical protein